MTSTFLRISLGWVFGLLSVSASAQELRVMSFNMWHGGDAGGQPLERSLAAIEASGAQIIGLQETRGYSDTGDLPDRAAEIAKKLNWHYWPQSGRRGILSRYPLGKPTSQGHGIEIKVSPTLTVLFFNVHFAASPYQPYQLLKIPYGSAPFIETEVEAINWAERSRGAQVTRLLDDMSPYLRDDRPVMLTGDFNEPSCQDWTDKAQAAGLCPIKVAYPTTERIRSRGLRDCWREKHPNEVDVPGWTWTPTTLPTDPQDKHDRIDFVLCGPNHWKVLDCQRVGEPGNSEISLQDWPSDHRAVVATLEFQVER